VSGTLKQTQSNLEKELDDTKAATAKTMEAFREHEEQTRFTWLCMFLLYYLNTVVKNVYVILFHYITLGFMMRHYISQRLLIFDSITLYLFFMSPSNIFVLVVSNQQIVYTYI